GIDDLAVDAPKEAKYGTVMVFRGAANKQLKLMAYFGSLDGDHEDSFGSVLAAGDFDGDGVDELVAGQPYDTVNNVEEAGRLWVVRITQTQVLLESTLDHTNLPGDPQHYGRIGDGGLAAGRIGDDKYDDLVIGSPFYSVSIANTAGQVIVVRGGPNGLDPAK